MAKLSPVYVHDGEIRLPLTMFDGVDGGVYSTRGLARCGETGVLLVIYTELDQTVETPPTLQGELIVRRWFDWIEPVSWPDGVLRPRHVPRLGPRLEVPLYKVTRKI